jgi:acetyl esterase/lipase
LIRRGTADFFLNKDLSAMMRYQVEEYLSLFLLSGRVGWANWRSPHYARIQFGSHPQQFLLLCLPPAGVTQKKAAIVFTHGGGWRMGNPAVFGFIGNFLADLGFPTILPGYRLAPMFKFPTQLDDLYAGCEAGIKALRERGITPKKWIIGGQSSGAQLAALAAYADPARRDAMFGELAGLFLVSGLLDFSLCDSGDAVRLVADFTGDGENRLRADPIRYLRGGETLPVFCIHGDRDPLVDPQNSLAFAAKIGAAAQVYLARGWHHSDLVAIFIRSGLPVTEALLQWLKAV